MSGKYIQEKILDELKGIRQLLTPKSPVYKTPITQQTTSYRMGLKGTTKSRSRLGYVVGKELELSYEVMNLGDNHFPSGMIRVVMNPPNGQYVGFNFRVPKLQPKEKITIDRNENNQPLVTNVMAEGFTLFSASITGSDGVKAVIESPPGTIRGEGISFMHVFGKPMAEIYEMIAMYAAVIGLIGTFIVSAIQLAIS